MLGCIHGYDIRWTMAVQALLLFFSLISFRCCGLDISNPDPCRGRGVPFLPLLASRLQRREHNAIWFTVCCSLDPVDVYTSPLIELVVELFLLALFVRDDSWVDCHLGVGSSGATLRQSAGVDGEHTVDDLKVIVMSGRAR